MWIFIRKIISFAKLSGFIIFAKSEFRKFILSVGVGGKTARFLAFFNFDRIYFRKYKEQDAIILFHVQQGGDSNKEIDPNFV